jgi:hypothetical protein
MTAKHTQVCYYFAVHFCFKESYSTNSQGVIPHLLRALHEAGIITEDLALPDDSHSLEATYRGLCKLPDTVDIDGRILRRVRRRIDILSIPWQSRGGALLYYTVCCTNQKSKEAIRTDVAALWRRAMTLYVPQLIFHLYYVNYSFMIVQPCHALQS